VRVTTGWTVQSGLCGVYNHYWHVIVAIALWTVCVAHWNWIAELGIWISPPGRCVCVCMCVDTRIGDEGVKALGDALKDNTTLTSLSLYLYCR
jgi:hypothetical protein